MTIHTRMFIRVAAAGLLGLSVAAGCDNPEKKQPEFHTSGSRQGDQRAEQQVAKVQQLRGEGVSDSGKKKSGSDESKSDVNKSLFERLGGEPGIGLIVEDWVNR